MTTEITLNALGFIPGPSETKECFLERVEYCKTLSSTLFSTLEFPSSFVVETAKEPMEEAFEIAQPLFGIAPLWIPLVFSNAKLPLWQGGALWIFQQTENAPLGALLQLRSLFRKKSCYLNLYQRKEILAHELSHVGRMAFEEPKFEELFAYQTSSSWFQRTFGPLFQSSMESLIFVILLLAIFCLNVMTLISLESMLLLAGTLAAIALFLGGLIFRLMARQRQLYRAKRALTEVFHGDEKKARFLLYRLTDREIVEFSKWKKEAIVHYMTGDLSYRWEFLRSVYDISDESTFDRI